MPPMLSPMSQCTIANLALIPVVDVTQCPIDHAKAIKVSILSVTHLAKAKVIAIWIDCLNTPIAFFGDQCVETLEFFVINNP
jgi:hypothetical protein